MEPTSGRFAGHVIDDEAAGAGAHSGDVLEPPTQSTPDEPPVIAPFTYEAAEPAEEPAPVAELPPDAAPFTYEAPEPVAAAAEVDEVFVNPAAFAPRVQKGPTAVGVAPQTENLFADEVLAETPVAQGNRRAGVAKRTKKADAAVTAAIVADAAANARPRSVFDDPDAHMEPTVTEPDRLPPLNEKHRSTLPDGRPSLFQRIRDFFGNLGRVTVGIIVAVLIGAVVAGYVVAAFGPWQVTDTGIVKRDLGAPVNALPEGTLITMTRLGTVKASGAGVLFPVALQTATAKVVGSALNAKGETTGYTVECLSGSCPKGANVDIQYAAIVGSGTPAF